jgi:hypothetical protein
MRNSICLALFVLVFSGLSLLSGCKPDSSKDVGYFCRYNFPWGIPEGKIQPECKHFSGSDWNETAAREACEVPFGSVVLPTQFSKTDPCDTVSPLAFCTNDDLNDLTVITYYYQLEPPPVGNETGTNLAAMEGGCEQWEGVFVTTADYNATPSSQLFPEAQVACNSTATVDVIPNNIDDETLAQYRENNGSILFIPKSVTPKAGLIIYPGGRIDSRAYAPAAQLIADSGTLVAILPVPGYIAISGGTQEKSTYIIDYVANDLNITIDKWFIAGHSLGAQATTQYAYNQTRPIAGIIILGSYLSSETDFSLRSDLGLLVMIGSLEKSGTPGTVDNDSYLASKVYAPNNLPDNNTTYPIIEGGVHFGFCYQENPPQYDNGTISVSEQHTIYTNIINNFIDTTISTK